MTRSAILVALALAQTHVALAAGDKDSDSSGVSPATSAMLPGTAALLDTSEMANEASDLKKTLEKEFKIIADMVAKNSGQAVTIGFSNADTSVGVAAGTTEKGGKETVGADYKLPGGSLTKPLTAASIMHLVDKGTLKLDQYASPLIDSYIGKRKKQGDWSYKWTSCEDLWPSSYKKTVSTVTIEDLMAMKIKAPDFDGGPGDLPGVLWKKSFLDPFAILQLVQGQDWGKGGGEWGGYSSTNYVLLGMVLAEATGGAMPDEFDQGLYLPKSLKGYLAFGNNGQKVKDFTHIHVYSKHKGDWWNSAGPMVSWTASDILASGEGYARMIYEIYGTTSITKSGKEMAKQASTIKYGCYGFGTECRWYGKHGDSYCGKSLEGTDYGDLWGHGGSTYGARTVSLYNPTLKIAVSAGMNTDQQDDAVMNAFCLAYNTAINEVLKIPGKRKVSSSCKTFGTCCEPDPVGKSPTPRPGPSTPKPSPGPGPSPSPGGGGCPNGEDYGDDGGCGCIDDSAWEKNNSGGDCGWAGKDTAGRCGKKSDDGDTAYVACGATCTAKDSTSWMKGSDSSSNCNWVAGDPQDRCGKKMDGSGEHAYEACPHACGCPDSKKYVKKHKLKKSALAELAAKIAEAEDSVAVRVPTLVAVCVLAGVALGGVAALLAPKAKEPTEQEPLLAVSKTESFGL
mmetsp:Transcript_4520/g.14420  ORF Transcript_4520/g.14420 Transcript_4520/m.14420 type:complete len:679 (-) Transcript_4520:120-2156(-)